MMQMTGGGTTPPKMHNVIMIQMAVNIFCVLLIIFSKERPDTLIGDSVHWWIERSASVIRILLFFEPWPPSDATEKSIDGMQTYRHALAVSLFVAFCSITVSRRYSLYWSYVLNRKLERAGYSKLKRAVLALAGYRRMVIAVAATVFLALFSQPYDKTSIEWFYSSNWTLLRAPLLLGMTSAFVLLAVTFRQIVKYSRLHGPGFSDDGFN